MITNNTKLWYVCGPMSNRPQFNVPAFLNAAEVLVAKGHRAQLPADLEHPEVVARLLASETGVSSGSGLTWGDCLALDVKLIADVVDGVCVLPEWYKSKGAQLETFIAFRCRKPVVYFDSMRPVRKKALIKAWLDNYK
jgi:hypothetical protein